MDALTEKRRDVRHLLTELASLEQELAGLQGGPDYYTTRQRLLAQLEQKRQQHGRAAQELARLQHGTQSALF